MGAWGVCMRILSERSIKTFTNSSHGFKSDHALSSSFLFYLKALKCGVCGSTSVLLILFANDTYDNSSK